VSLRIFDEPHVHESEQPAVSIKARILFCFWAVLVASIPAATAVYSSLTVTYTFINLRNAETAGSEAIQTGLHAANIPLAIALAVAALLALGMAVALTINPQRRLAGVGLPLSIGVPVLAVTPGVFIWIAESKVVDLLAGRLPDLSVEGFAQHIASLLFFALTLGVLFLVVALCCGIVSLFIPVRSRTDPLSTPRAFVWLISGVLLLLFAGVFFILV
jgi:hypothetical protein